MKKRVLYLSILAILFGAFTLVGVGQENKSMAENPMASFMDAHWGMSATAFTQQFKYKNHLRKDDYFFYLQEFDLGELVIPKIRFKFESPDGQQEKLRKSNLDQIFLTEIYIFIKPEQFETMLKIFKMKYGEPKKYDEFEVRDSTGNSFLQKVARWEDEKIKRMILMERQASKLVDGMITFIPIKEKVQEKKGDTLKEAAEKI
jgi:hypothetical protein